MKKLLPYSWLLPAFSLFILLSGCMKDKVSRTIRIMVPVYATKTDVYHNIKSGPVKELTTPGKIFIRGNYLFINEVDKGIHIYNNSDPTAPRAVSFISIPGNIDIALSGDYLYADMYTDMLTIDISDPLNAKLVDSSLNVFPERNGYGGWVAEGSIIVEWIEKDTTITGDVTEWYERCQSCFYAAAAAPNNDAGGNPIPGIAGSMARIVVVNDFLYAVNFYSLIVFDINNKSKPVRRNEQNLGRMIETIYPFRNNLFIGSTTGMFIYNIDQPDAPVQKGIFEHVASCDPVISDGDYAYVTLRSGTQCSGFTNQLEIIDVSNLMQPNLVKVYEMHNPQGLGKDGDILFICDGEHGIKVYDASDVQNLKWIFHISDINAYDAIPWQNRLLVSAADGLHQFDYSDPYNIKSLSTISIAGK